ncbi:MAG: hypothetical protein RI983_1537 [Bacteroidota bacterium]
MRLFLFLCCLLIFMSCENPKQDTLVKTDSLVVKLDTIAENRINPSAKPVATYTVPVDDGMGNINSWKFAVNMFETTKTFEFKVNIQYKEIRSTEIIQIPNFNIAPVVGIQPGKNPLSCLIGFNDAKGNFKEYILVSVNNDQLKFKKINSYKVRRYSAPATNLP